MYFHLPPSEKNSNPIPPWFWGTVEISIGLLAACLPPMGTLIRRTPSPSELFASMRRRVSLRFSRGSRPSKGLSSDQHASKIDGFNNNREATDDVNEMADF